MITIKTILMKPRAFVAAFAPEEALGSGCTKVERGVDLCETLSSTSSKKGGRA